MGHPGDSHKNCCHQGGQGWRQQPSFYRWDSEGLLPLWMVKLYSLETQFMLSRILQLGRMERPHLSQLFALGQEKVLSSPQTRG